MSHRVLGWAVLGVLVLGSLYSSRIRVAAGETPVEPPTVDVLPASDAERKSALDSAAQGESEKAEEPTLAALAIMQTRKHDDFVPVLRKLVNDENPKVQAAAVRAAASQGLKDLDKAVRKLLHAKPKKGAAAAAPEALAAACVDYLGRLGIAGEEASVLKEQLQPTISDPQRLKQDTAGETIRAALYYLGKLKYKQAVPYMIEELLPQPVGNPSDPKNPEADYWEARTKLWHDYEGWTRWVLKETTGREYRSLREWQAWFKQQDRKAFK